MANAFDTVPVNTLQALLMQGRGGEDAFQQQMRPLQLQEQRGKIQARDQLSQMLAGGGTPDYSRMALGMLAAGDPTGAGVLANLVNQQAQRGMQERQIEINERLANQRDIPSGFERAPGGGLRAIPGGPGDPQYKRQVGDRQNAPPGYRWIDPENPEAGLKAIPGGPAEKVDAEVAARVGLGKSFLGQLEDTKDEKGNVVPGVMSRVGSGEATGLIDYTMGAAGLGEAGKLHRQIASGADALLRNLTGAGMSASEAKEYADRYRPTWRDDAESLKSKLEQLQRELGFVRDEVGKGRGGASAAGAPAASSQNQRTAPQQYREGQTATNPQTGQKLMFRGGQWVPAQ